MTTLIRAKQLLEQGSVEVQDAPEGVGPFGSWHLVLHATPPLRLMWDGKDQWFVIEQWTLNPADGQSEWKGVWAGPQGRDQDPEPAVAKAVEFISGGLRCEGPSIR